MLEMWRLSVGDVVALGWRCGGSVIEIRWFSIGDAELSDGDVLAQ